MPFILGLLDRISRPTLPSSSWSGKGLHALIDGPGKSSDSIIVVTVNRKCYSIRISCRYNEIIPSDTNFIAHDNFACYEVGIGENELVVQVRNVRLNGLSGVGSRFVNNGFVRIVVSVSVHV